MAATVAARRGVRPARVGLRVLRAAALAAGVYGAVVFVLQPILGHFSGEFEDFAAYLAAAQASAAHSDIYATFTQQTQNVALSGFDYPPVIAFLLTPLAWLPSGAAATVFLVAGVAATLAGAVLVARSVLPQAWPRNELAVLATFLFAPSTYNFWHGQMNPVVFLLLGLGFHSWMRGREVRAGLLIGAAAMLKLAPVVLLVIFIKRRWWKGIAAAVAVLVAGAAAGIAAFGWHTTVEYVRSVLPVLSRDDGWLYNQSWSGVINRLADHSVLTFQPFMAATRAAWLALCGATIVATALVVRSRNASDMTRGAEYGAAVIAMLLCGTLTWYAQDVHLLIPMAAAAGLALQNAQRRLLVMALVAVLCCTALLAPALIAILTMQGILAASHTSAWWFLIQLASLPALSAALLFAALLVALRRQGAPAGALTTS